MALSDGRLSPHANAKSGAVIVPSSLGPHQMIGPDGAMMASLSWPQGAASTTKGIAGASLRSTEGIDGTAVEVRHNQTGAILSQRSLNVPSRSSFPT